MTLREKQSVFARKISVLQLVAYELGYEVTLGDAYRDPRCPYGHDKSLHKQRLAVDLNLFIDGNYITDWTGHDRLHDVWDMLGGAERIDNDPNHYSLEHNGVR